ncbi:hypothetical protein IIA29_05665, partial [candidate division KSB1 bacterium]|nr:hypothetical protein [candidate division KSB1 bacterium]
MGTTVRILTVLVLVGVGYLLGSLQWLPPQKVQAQAADLETPEEKIKLAYRALKEAQDMLVARGRYQAAING